MIIMEQPPIVDLASFNLLTVLGLITLVSYVVLIPVTVYLSKKTNFFGNLNAWIDKKLGDEMPKEQPAAAQPEAPAPAQSAQETDTPPENELDKEGIASFKLRVKDIYYCRLSYKNRNLRTQDVSWVCNNLFIGKVERNGLFTGNRAGTVIISCLPTGASPDETQQMYQLHVVPTNPNWFADKILSHLFKGTKQDIIEASLSESRKIVAERPADRIVIFEGESSDKKLSLQFNVYKELERALFEMRDNSEAGYNKLVEELNERFEEVKLTQNRGIRVWAHQKIDDFDEEVDFYAFVRTTISHTYLGFGRFWREYGSIEEFKLNIRLAEAMFEDLLPGVSPVEVEADKAAKPEEPVKQPKTTPPVTPLKNLGEQLSEDKPVPVTEPGPDPDTVQQQEEVPEPEDLTQHETGQSPDNEESETPPSDGEDDESGKDQESEATGSGESKDLDFDEKEPDIDQFPNYKND